MISDVVLELARENTALAIGLETPVIGSGMDSLDYVSFIVAVEGRLDVSIPRSTAAEFMTFADVTRWLETHDIPD